MSTFGVASMTTSVGLGWLGTFPPALPQSSFAVLGTMAVLVRIAVQDLC